MKRRRAVEWGLVDEAVSRPQWTERVRAYATGIAGPLPTTRGITLPYLEKTRTDTGISYRYVSALLDRSRSCVEVTVRGPAGEPTELGPEFWTLAMTRELDDLILDLRTNELDLGTWLLRTVGDPATVLAHDEALLRGGWLETEILLYLKRTLKRLDVTSRSLIALIEPGSCFAGSLLELVLAADRSYHLFGTFEDAPEPAEPAALVLGRMNLGPLPMGNDLTRLQSRFYGHPLDRAAAESRLGEPLLADEALALGLVTFAPDDIDWAEELRLAVEERASFSPDALTGLEGNLRFVGPETIETKIFGRLSAWQNWIFYRPNASGDTGALRRFGTGQRGTFDRKRV